MRLKCSPELTDLIASATCILGIKVKLCHSLGKLRQLRAAAASHAVEISQINDCRQRHTGQADIFYKLIGNTDMLCRCPPR